MKIASRPPANCKTHQGGVSLRGLRACGQAWLLCLCLLGMATVAAQSAPDSSAPDASADPAATGVDVRVSVLYLTNRRRDAEQPPAMRYDGERGEAHFGRCEVAFSPIPIINDMAPRMSFHVPRETQEVVLAERLDQATFWDQLEASRGRGDGGPVILFVHGYNYSFERTCRRAAQLQRSLGERATLLTFSWPSNAEPTDYVPDQADVEWSVPLLAETLSSLGDRVGRQGLRLVAHSLGTRGVVQALQRLAAEDAGQVEVDLPKVDQLILLAPDFDAQTFVDLLPTLDPLVGRITLYASSNDTPLKLSRQLSGYPRLGEAGPYLTVVPGIETIDVSALGRYQITGHEYFYFHPVVTSDLVTLLITGGAAAERAGLRSRSRAGLRYWELTDPIEETP
jgi:esterase/lipase superfamily enzyme